MTENTFTHETHNKTKTHPVVLVLYIIYGNRPVLPLSKGTTSSKLKKEYFMVFITKNFKPYVSI